MVIPRFVVAAPHSGSGKTTVATGLMAALSTGGHTVAPFKVGPDYIDPGYHSLATGRPGRNLDPFLTSEELIAPLFLHGARGADVAVIEGVMGLFDGQLGTDSFASTAHVAKLLRAPVLLVVDIRHMSRSAGAIVAGFNSFDPAVRIAGVILNHVGSPRHEAEARAAIESLNVPVLGALPRSLEIEAPSRHLGLVPAAERDDAGILQMGRIVAQNVDLDELLSLASAAPELAVEPWDPAAVVTPTSPRLPRIGIASGRAFTFRYPETDELLNAGNCELVEFDPALDDSLPPDLSGLWIGGGFPEVHAEDLSGKTALRAEIRELIDAGLPTVAECAGLIYLSESIDGTEMVGALRGHAAMTGKLTMGYRMAEAPTDSLLGRAGEQVRGHEFHRTTLATDDPAWLIDERPDGHATPTLHASYLHTHWAGQPQLAQRFIDAVHGYATPRFRSSSSARSARTETHPTDPRSSSSARSARIETPDVGLWHHGDKQLEPGLIDFAVNVRQPETPQWLFESLVSERNWAAYPDSSEAIRALARQNRVQENQVLPLAGAAEAFTLIARAFDGDVTIIHPQFTEPETAMLAAGRSPRRHILAAEDGFVLNPALVPPSDVAIVGNPTNPTGVLHKANDLRRINAGTLVVDEAFLDAVEGEPESLIGGDMRGIVVLRSLTKTWALAGIRAGYAVGDAPLIARLAEQQPTWSVSTPALTALVACSRPEALDEVRHLARQAARERTRLVDRLASLGIPTVEGKAPFVLADTSSISDESLVEPLARLGIAARRCDTFPGLGPTWLRLAVRNSTQHEALIEALRNIKER